ncbi:MAG: radical SAM protein [Thaumarchaeota archaeon]|nr:radical SAM protein [Nitrososphaerota archaeon]
MVHYGGLSSLDLYSPFATGSVELVHSDFEQLKVSKIEVREVKCSSLLHSMSFGGYEEFTINLYRGCTHGCVYCYAPSLIHDERSWGAYVDAKINAPSVLDRELRRAKKQVVFVSSASDPYQPVEAKYEITRKVLNVLLKHDFPVLILTRSPLVLRDLDLLQQFKWVRVGFSISSVPTKSYEPGVPSLGKRLEAIKKLSESGITTWVSMAPLIPKLILTDLDTLFQRIKASGVSTVTIGVLRFTGYEESRIMFEERTGKISAEVMKDGAVTRQRIVKLAQAHGIDTNGDCLSWKNAENELQSLERFGA